MRRPTAMRHMLLALQCDLKCQTRLRTKDGHDQVEVVVGVRCEGERAQVARRNADAQLLVQLPAQRALRRFTGLQLCMSGSGV